MQQVKRALRRWVSAGLHRRGLALARPNSFPKRHAHGMAVLTAAGYTPHTVIDVGVAHGTPWLYDAFPKAKLILIDPNPRFAETLRVLQRRYRADVYHVALGAASGSLSLHIDENTPSSSSLMPVTDELIAARAAKGIARTFTDVTVPVQTLDATLRDCRGPYVLKIDTEGSELDVLLGATDTLRDTDVVITETNVARRFEGSYAFAEIVALMDARGFRLFDVLDVRTFGHDGPVNYLDAVFVRRESDGRIAKAERTRPETASVGAADTAQAGGERSRHQ